MHTLSVVIITFNEEKKIGQCLDSVKDIADEIIVVDSNSTDATEEICRQYDVKFVTQKWLGYSEQKNLADNLATCDLIFSIDADEALSDELKKSIQTLKEIQIADNEVFSMNRLNNFWGRWIKRCGYYPENKVRIWRRGFAQWEGLIHEWLKYESEPKKTLLNGDLLHYSYDSPEAFKKQLFHFAELNAQSYYDPMPAWTAGKVSVTDDPLYSHSTLVTLPDASPVTWLATLGDWAYIESSSGDYLRGFVPLGSLTTGRTFSLQYLPDQNDLPVWYGELTVYPDGSFEYFAVPAQEGSLGNAVVSTLSVFDTVTEEQVVCAAADEDGIFRGSGVLRPGAAGLCFIAYDPAENAIGTRMAAQW